MEADLVYPLISSLSFSSCKWMTVKLTNVNLYFMKEQRGSLPMFLSL